MAMGMAIPLTAVNHETHQHIITKSFGSDYNPDPQHMIWTLSANIWIHRIT